MSRQSRPLEHRYFDWLYRQINTSDAHSHSKLAKQMHSTPFLYFVRNDDNREADGRALRDEFLERFAPDEWDDSWYSLECSVLEMMIALSKRMSFEAYDLTTRNTPKYWFWHMMDNLTLSNVTDDVYDSFAKQYVAMNLEVLNTRTYRPNGSGGLFPLKHEPRDQRRVEIWYQMSAYLLEKMEESED